MTYQATVNGEKIVSNDFNQVMEMVENILKGKDCTRCHGKGSYMVANGDDQDYEYCQHD